MSTKFTAREKDTINRAWDAIAHELDGTNWEMPHAWRDALKTERKACNSVTAAKGLMVECFADGVRKPASAAELFSIRPGAREAHLIGAALWHHANARAATHTAIMNGMAQAARIQTQLLPLCDASRAANRVACDRFIKSTTQHQEN